MNDSPTQPEPERSLAEPAQSADTGFAVVGIGASAGGLEALRAFLSSISPTTGMAFVVVMHLSPEHQSHLAELLQSSTSMPVAQVTELIKIQPNSVYVIPPNRNISTIDTHLRLSALEDRPADRAPLDHFLRTLADSHGSEAIAVILSGGGSDGALGVKRIKEFGGLIFVQDPAEAAYNGMPESAIQTGTVDFVLPVAEIAAKLDEVSRTVVKLPAVVEGEPIEDEDRVTLQRIFVQVRTSVGHDFSRYKPSTILRRLQRRLQVHGLTTLPEYLELLRTNRGEIDALFRDLLIAVTNFFREGEAFDALAGDVLPELFGQRTAADTIRIWVPGCATGEEAYSLAMLFLEHAETIDSPPNVQIFATDPNERALAIGREGMYPEVIKADVPADYLERYFAGEQGGYRVQPFVREMILFAAHDILRDPPFSRLDLISCRNLLIYLRREIQLNLFELFHYALRPGGFLFLGSSESVDELTLFRPVNKRYSVYQRQQISSTEPYLPVLPMMPGPRLEPIPRRADVEHAAEGYGGLHQRLVEMFAPPSVVVNESQDVVHLSERAGRYMRLPGGAPTRNILQLVREELHLELTPMLHAALDKDQASRSRPVRVNMDGQQRLIELVVNPSSQVHNQRFAIIFFLESEVAESVAQEQTPEPGSEAIIKSLQDDLAATRRRLRTIIEEFETSQEEMRASNEELQSMNEELRSATEELETSKEELQSMNEELLSVNEENRSKVEELHHLTSDLQNLLAATDIATLFLDRQLSIKRFTPAISEVFNIMPADSGRPLAHLTHKLVGQDDLIDDAMTVLRTLIPQEREVRSQDGHWYLLRLLPYRSADHRIDGVVLTLVDITKFKKTEQALQASQERYGLIVESVKEYAVFSVDIHGRIDSWNPGAERIFGYDESYILGEPIDILYTAEDRATGIPQAELATARDAGQSNDERWYVRKDGSLFWGTGVTTSLWRDGQLRGYANIRRDNTVDKQVEQQLRESRERLARLNESLEERVLSRTKQVRRLASELVSAEQRVRTRLSYLLHDDLQQLLYAVIMQLQVYTDEWTEGETEPARLAALHEVDETLRRAVQLTRQLAIEMNPPVLSSEGLRETLYWLGAQMLEAHDLTVEIEVDGAPELTDVDERTLVFQVIQELLFNVLKHSGVNSAKLVLREEPDGISITVEDNGRGFDSASAGRERGFGLYSARERIELFGGRLDVTSSPGKGTSATVFIPADGADGGREEE